MECKYLKQFRLSEFGWAVESCTANDRPYVPSISELQNYCKGSEFRTCHILLRRESICMDSAFTVEKLVTA